MRAEKVLLSFLGIIKCIGAWVSRSLDVFELLLEYWARVKDTAERMESSVNCDGAFLLASRNNYPPLSTLSCLGAILF